MGHAPVFLPQPRWCQYATVAGLVALTALAPCMAQTHSQEALDEQSLNVIKQNPDLLPELGNLFERLARDVQFPPPRAQSRLLPLLPESTVFYAAVPNYGETSHQALRIFQQQLQQSPALRAWWQQGGAGKAAPRIEELLNSFYALSQYLGDEIAVSAEISPLVPRALVVAEIRKPGLRTFLQQLAGASKTPPILDEHELDHAQETGAGQWAVLVRPDFVAAATDVATLRSFNQRVEEGRRDFASTPFGRRISQTYDGGAMMVAALDFQRVLSQLPPGAMPQWETFRRTGFADLKYLVWEHKSVGGQTVGQAELSFTGPRHGIAAWLAAPTKPGGLDFVSQKPILAATVVLTDPAGIFEEIRSLSSTANPNAFVRFDQFEQSLGINLKRDVLSQLGGEITIEAESLSPPQPEWRLILRVKDPVRLQESIGRLLAAAGLKGEQFEEGGTQYHSFGMPV
ncbi:MAG TPA: hypothetical protein VFB00_03015, partial [Terriglobales bacterium]|nr:hypothetical protein [Terriglobales bacterium]